MFVQCWCVFAVMLQPFDQDLSEHSKHRFMVQSMLVPDQAVDNHEQLVSLESIAMTRYSSDCRLITAILSH